MHVCYGKSSLIMGGRETERTCLFQRELENGCSSDFRLRMIFFYFPPIFTFAVDCLIVSRKKAQYDACNKTQYEQL